jgi:hypothetical protein
VLIHETSTKLMCQIPRCHELTKKGCLDSMDYITCNMAIDYCEAAIGESFVKAGVNPCVPRLNATDGTGTTSANPALCPSWKTRCVTPKRESRNY